LIELCDLLKGTQIEGEPRRQATDAISSVLTDGLIPTFLELRAIRASQGKGLPLTEHFQLYEDFARKLWKSYKDLKLFSAATRVIPDILVVLMSLRLPPRVRIVEHDDKVHGHGWPNRFRWAIDGLDGAALRRRTEMIEG
jgi:hypothetical protein